MKYLVVFFCLLSLIGFSQKEHSKWYFGWKAALDFTSGFPVSINGSNLISSEGCVSIADSSGNLLFYSNGVTVWNKNNVVMDNGSGLMGDQSTTQSCFVVKKPGNTAGIYYLFTLGEQGFGSLGYSTIDMSLAAGLGSVTTKNDTLANNMTEKLHGTLHCNGSDVWVVGHKYNSNEFYAYLVSAAGVNTIPVISAVGSMHAVTNGTVNGSSGVLRFSSNGKKIGLAITGPQIVELLDFNASNGLVNNSMLLATNFNGYPYGCEFSPDGSKLYVTENIVTSSQLHQWDLCAGSNSAIINSHQIIDSLSSSVAAILRAAQLALDGKIYVVNQISPFISVINNPNSLGLACNFVPQGIQLTPTTNVSYAGLPNHMNSAHRQKAQINAAVSGSCGMVTFSYTPPPFLCALASESVSSIEWRFNDSAAPTSTSSATSPQHLYTQNGNYTVALLVRYACYTDTLKQIVPVSDFPNLTVTGKQTICTGEKVSFTLGGASTYSLNGVASNSTFLAQPTANTVYTISGAVSGTAVCVAKKTVSVTILPCTNLTSISQQAGNLRIYPNPSSGIFTIETEVGTEIQISDVSGRLVLLKTLNPGKQSIDLSGEAHGIYFVKAKNAHTSFRFKLVKEP